LWKPSDLRSPRADSRPQQTLSRVRPAVANRARSRNRTTGFGRTAQVMNTIVSARARKPTVSASGFARCTARQRETAARSARTRKAPLPCRRSGLLLWVLYTLVETRPQSSSSRYVRPLSVRAAAAFMGGLQVVGNCSACVGARCPRTLAASTPTGRMLRGRRAARTDWAREASTPRSVLSPPVQRSPPAARDCATQ